MGSFFRFCLVSKKLYPANGFTSKLPAFISERADKGSRKTNAATISAARYIAFIVRPPLYCFVLLLLFRLWEKSRPGYLYANLCPKNEALLERQKGDRPNYENSLSSLFARVHAEYLMPY